MYTLKVNAYSAIFKEVFHGRADINPSVIDVKIVDKSLNLCCNREVVDNYNIIWKAYQENKMKSCLQTKQIDSAENYERNVIERRI